jgi:hypothetical protein
MFNLYSEGRGQAAIRVLFHVSHDRTRNLPLLPAIFPDQFAPVVRNNADGRELVLVRWGMPGPPQYGGQPVTKIRNVMSPVAPGTGASFPRYRSANTPTPGRARRLPGSRSRKTGPSSPSPYGPTGIGLSRLVPKSGATSKRTINGISGVCALATCW